jgi:hypothetical protein
MSSLDTLLLLQKNFLLGEVLDVVMSVAERFELRLQQKRNCMFRVSFPEPSEKPFLEVALLEQVEELSSPKDVIFTLNLQNSDYFSAVEMTIFVGEQNVVSRLSMETRRLALIPGNPDFEIAKVHYQFAKTLHDTLDAKLTEAWIETSDEPYYRFGHGENKLILEFEDV